MHSQYLFALFIFFNFVFIESFVSSTFKNLARNKIKIKHLEAFADENEALQLLERASTVFGQNQYAIRGDNIYDAIRFLEKLLPEKRKKAEDAERMFRNLSPHKWQLILTTGDLDTQKTLGPQIKYVPLVKAVQLFDGSRSPFFIRNGIYFGGIPIAEFEGVFRWQGESRRLEFDFRTVKLFGSDITNLLPTDVKRGAGLLVGEHDQYKVQPAFTWIEVDECIAIARGAGGGVALWRRVDTMPTMYNPEGNKPSQLR